MEARSLRNPEKLSLPPSLVRHGNFDALLEAIF